MQIDLHQASESNSQSNVKRRHKITGKIPHLNVVDTDRELLSMGGGEQQDQPNSVTNLESVFAFAVSTFLGQLSTQ